MRLPADVAGVQKWPLSLLQGHKEWFISAGFSLTLILRAPTTQHVCFARKLTSSVLSLIKMLASVWLGILQKKNTNLIIRLV